MPDNLISHIHHSFTRYDTDILQTFFNLKWMAHLATAFHSQDMRLIWYNRQHLDLNTRTLKKLSLELIQQKLHVKLELHDIRKMIQDNTYSIGYLISKYNLTHAQIIQLQKQLTLLKIRVANNTQNINQNSIDIDILQSQEQDDKVFQQQEAQFDNDMANLLQFMKNEITRQLKGMIQSERNALRLPQWFKKLCDAIGLTSLAEILADPNCTGFICKMKQIAIYAVFVILGLIALGAVYKIVTIIMASTRKSSRLAFIEDTDPMVHHLPRGVVTDTTTTQFMKRIIRICYYIIMIIIILVLIMTLDRALYLMIQQMKEEIKIIIYTTVSVILVTGIITFYLTDPNKGLKRIRNEYEQYSRTQKRCLQIFSVIVKTINMVILTVIILLVYGAVSHKIQEEIWKIDVTHRFVLIGILALLASVFMFTYCLLEAKKGHKININLLKIEENDEIEMHKFTLQELRDITDS